MVAIADNNGGESYDQPTVGLILPPPEIRSMVEKTASFVARNGENFEQKIKQNEASNPKFDFLKEENPYNLYYRKKVGDFMVGTATLQKQDENTTTVEAAPEIKQKLMIPTTPPEEFEFCHDPPTMNALDLDIVKLTAIFVARNGRSFLTQLMQKEAKNYQFDFLRPQHTLFQYFSKLVEQYNKVLIPSKNMRAKLKSDLKNQQAILDDVNYRAEWGRYQERIRKQEQEKQEKERVAYAEIDWHDFCIVESVDFPLHERSDLPAPVTKEELGVRMARMVRIEQTGYDEQAEQVQQRHEPEQQPEQAQHIPQKPQIVERDLGNEVQEQIVPAAPKPMAPIESAPPVLNDNIVVRSNYNPKAKTFERPQAGDVEFLISPLTGERIPASKMSEHMRIGLLDPAWVEQRKKEIAKKKEEEDYYAQDAAVASSLSKIARKRTDIFGVEETGIGREVGEEKKRVDEIGWDGHKKTVGQAISQQHQSDEARAQERRNQLNRGELPEDLQDNQFEAPGPRTQPALPHPGAPTAPRVIPLVRHVVPQPVIHMQQRTPMGAIPRMGMAGIGVPGAPGMQMGMRPPVMGMHSGMQMGMRPMAPGGSVTMGMRPQGGMPQGRPTMGIDMGGPPVKKARPEDNLIPEEDFLRTEPARVVFQISVPKVEKDDWKCRGQLISVTMPLTATFTEVKQKIEEETGMPPQKQKLQVEGAFVKDQNSLAYYNVRSSTLVLLTLKERGGRKK